MNLRSGNVLELVGGDAEKEEQVKEITRNSIVPFFESLKEEALYVLVFGQEARVST